MDLALVEATQTIDRYYNQQDRIREQEGPGSTDHARAISGAYICRVIDAIPEALAELARRMSPLRGLRPLVLQLPHERIALAALQGALCSIGWQQTFGDTLRTLGTTLADEAWAAGLLHHDRRLAARIERSATQREFRVSKARGTVVEQRRTFAKQAAERLGFTMAEWPARERTLAGGWLLDVLLKTLPEVFVIEGDGEWKQLTITDETARNAEALVEEIIARNPVFMPRPEPPLPWTDLHSGGPAHQNRARVCLVRTRHAVVRAAWRAAIKEGMIQPALDGLNALQGVPWTINRRVLGVMEACIFRGIPVKGLPHHRVEVPKVPADLSPEETRVLYKAKRAARIHNSMVTGEEVMLAADLKTAHMMAELEQFHTPMNMDFRGRVYNLTQFHFQREDRVRGLFLFKHGEPITEEGIEWLKVHLATVGAFDRIDKTPFAARKAWVDAHLSELEEIAACPLVNLGWTKAKKPWLFLAAVFELISAITNGPKYVAHLPIAFDGACNGLQHLCAMTRAPEGHLVNLCPNTSPEDIYSIVALTAEANVCRDARSAGATADDWRPKLAEMLLKHGIDRDLVKRNTMTFSYGSKRQGMAAQQQEDTMAPLATEVLEGKRKEHPFGDVWSRGSVDHPGLAARYIADHSMRAIQETVSYPAQAMVFLQRIARTMAHESKCARWTTPVGIPWMNLYNVPIIETINLWLYDHGTRVRHQTDVAVGDEVTIAKEKSANAVSPNLVHAVDASHLLRVAARGHHEGIAGLATVHDSYGCLPSRAAQFRQIIREEFVHIYEQHDILAEVLTQARFDLTLHNHNRLPALPEYGDLDIMGVLEADYAFA